MLKKFTLQYFKQILKGPENRTMDNIVNNSFFTSLVEAVCEYL